LRQSGTLRAHYEQYSDPEFHPRLKTDWPEDLKQLHSGGWQKTKASVEIIESKLKKSGGKDDIGLIDL